MTQREWAVRALEDARTAVLVGDDASADAFLSDAKALVRELRLERAVDIAEERALAMAMQSRAERGS